MNNNNQNQNIYLKTDDNTIINENSIRWIKKINECLYVCSKATGCRTDVINLGTKPICKLNNPESYDKLNKYFE
jgi:hypothetical protein